MNGTSGGDRMKARDDACRTLLFHVDTATMQRPAAADPPEASVVQLTGVYHNPHRRRAEGCGGEFVPAR